MNRVKNYDIPEPVRVLGEGAMGEVFYAIEAGLGREVALKRVRPDVANSPGVMDRFRKEAQVQAQLNHPNIAQIWEFFQSGSEYYLAMEFINGPNLAKILREAGRLSWEDAVGYSIQALRGLAHAHRQGIVHRDIKPANLVRGKDGQLKVTDFGIARVRGASRETRVGTIIGTYEYISPEAAQAMETTAVSDLYSLGVVMFEMLTGRLPFQSDNDYELLRMHVSGARPSVRTSVKEIPVLLDDAVQKAMDRKAARRYRSAEEMIEALQECLDRRNAPGGIWQKIIQGRGKTVQDSVATDRRRTDISSACHRVEDLIEQHLFSEAGAVLDAGMRSYPSEPNFLELRNRLQRQSQQYDQAVAQQAELIRDLMKRGLPDEALRLAAHALTLYPRAAALVDLQRECQRRVELSHATAGEMAQLQANLDELSADGRFQEAADHVLELLSKQHNQAELNRLLARVLQARRLAEKQAAIRQAVHAAITEARELESTHSLQAARARLTRDFETLGGEAPMIGELARIDAAIEAARKAAAVSAAIGTAGELRRSRNWRGALDVLDRAASQEGSDPQLDDMRSAIAGQLQEHENDVARAAEEARQRFLNSQWEDAVLYLAIAVRELPGEQLLTDLLHEAQRGLGQKRRAETIARIKAEAGERMREFYFAEALRLLLDAVAQYPEDETLGAALNQAICERDAHLARERASAALHRAADLRGENQFEAAIAVLRSVLREQPANREIQDSLSATEGEWHEICRQSSISELASAVEAGLASENYGPALEKLTGALAEWPEDPQLVELAQRTRAAQRQTEARKVLAEALKRGQAFEAGHQWGEAVQVYERSLAAFPEIATDLGPRLNAAQEQAHTALRVARIAELERNVRNWIGSGLLHEAGVELQLAEEEFPEEVTFAACRQLLQSEFQRLARESAVRNGLTEARRLLERQAFDEAGQMLAATQAEWGEDADLRDLQTSVLRAKQQYKDAVESALGGIQGQFEKQDWDAALAAVRAAIEQFPLEARFREMLEQARESRERQTRNLDISQKAALIDSLLAENAFDQAERLLAEARRDYSDNEEFDLRSRQLEKLRHQRERETAFLRAASEMEQLCRQKRWEQARQALTPFVEEPELRASVEPLLSELTKQEDRYIARMRELEERVRVLMEAKDYEAALALFEPAAVEFPEIAAFSRTLAELREKAAAERKTLRLTAADATIRSLMADRQYESALAEADQVLSEYPREDSLRDLRAMIVAGMTERAAAAAAGAHVARLLAAGNSADADRALVEGLRKYPGHAELEALRPGVDRARSAEWERQSREAGLKRTSSEIEKLLDRGRLEQAQADLAALEKVYGAGSAPELSRRIVAALAVAERERAAGEERAGEAERQRLATEQRERDAEAERLAEHERNRKLEEERRASAMEQAFRNSAAQAARLGEQRQWAQARQLLTPYLENPASKALAQKALDDFSGQEAQANARIQELYEKAGSFIQSGQLANARSLLDQTIRDFPEHAPFRKMLAEAPEPISSKQKAKRSGTVERTVRALLAQHHFEDALKELAAGLTDFPGEPAFLTLRAQTMSAIAERAAVAGVAREVQRLAAARQWVEADRILVEAQRRYPGRVEITELRAVVDAERKSRWDPRFGDLGLKRAFASIENLLFKGKPAEGGADPFDTATGAAPEAKQRTTRRTSDPAEKRKGPHQGNT